MKYLYIREELSKGLGYKIVIDDNSNQVILISNDNVLSTIKITEMDDDTYYVGGVASEKGLGLGLSLYKYAMMSIYPKKLMPSRDGDVRGGSWRIWEKLYNDNSVSKETLSIEDDTFSISIITGEEDYLTKEEFLDFIEEENYYRNRNKMGDVEDDLNIFNSMYSIKPSEEFINKSINIDELDTEEKSDIIRKADDLFSFRYNEGNVKSFMEYINENNSDDDLESLCKEMGYTYDLYKANMGNSSYYRVNGYKFRKGHH